jgi:hypothetical protein
VLAADIEVEEEYSHAVEYMPEAVRADMCIFTAEDFLYIHLKEDAGYRYRYDTGYEVVFVGMSGMFEFEIDTGGDDQQDDAGYDGLDHIVTAEEECEHDVDSREYSDHDKAAFGADSIGRLALKGKYDAMCEVHSRKKCDAIYSREIHLRKELDQRGVKERTPQKGIHRDSCEGE